ncbi:hypothetical protein CFC21_106568 [Triticum aestivum]|uniref:F-box domain-containing protein n=2 Tax=Triticum aestivum TaxID=4565 RepID=A0A3B6TBM7_WHEAT|nr:F-box protein At5g49610-like [Triticum aestivum]KAF7105793.1 hypothetical protein CFC21_106568 [Triticum aestivum]
MEAEEEGILEKKTNSRLGNHPGAGATAASRFTDDLILEILSRLPARSLHRFKCVSVRWRDLIADPANRKKLPQTLAGFLYTTYSNNARRHNFAGVSGDGATPFNPCLPYLQRGEYKDIAQVDACNGLLLCRCYNNKVTPRAEDYFRFVVCNPATGWWVELPPQPQTQDPANRNNHVAGLAFDPAVSSHFHVLCFEQTSPGLHITGVNIYSLRTGDWCHRDSGMVEKVALFFLSKCVFVGGMMYVIGSQLDRMNVEYALLGVDMEGKVWTTIRVPYSRRLGTIGSSQGCLHYAIPPADDNNKIQFSERAFWWLKDRHSKELVLKHTTSIDKLMSMTGQRYKVVGMHPDCDTIFLVSYERDTLVSYDMRHQKVGRILNLEKDHAQRFLPYVPLFSGSLAVADGQ